MNFIVKNFLRGLAVVIPIGLTVWIVYEIFFWTDRLLVDALPAAGRVPGAGVALALVLILAVGVLTSNIVGRKVLAMTESIFTRAPLVKLVYLSIKDLIEAFVGDRKRFTRPVLITLGEGMSARALGFITREDVTFPGADDHVMVYLPQSYNFAGNVFLVPRHHVEPIDADSSQVMALIVSGGISGSLHTASPTPQENR
jgi:uncharacterized membrane protein